jgi:serine/threonine protein phosphatase 1
MSKTYAIADLHGRYDLFEKPFNAIFDRGERDAKIITLGDYIDRGPESCMLIEILRTAQGLSSGKMICLKGNHEDIMWQTCRKLPSANWWLSNGGAATLMSYGQQLFDVVDVSIVPAAHLDWIEKLPLMHVDKHRVYVHAGVDPRRSLDDQDPENVIWKIYDDLDDGGPGQRHVVHGHHQHEHGPILKKNRTDLDTFAWYTGRLVVGVFDDDIPGGPIDFIEVKGEPARSS